MNTSTGEQMERFEFEFITDKLCIVVDKMAIEFTAFSSQLWNDLTLARMSDVNDIAVEYKKHISIIKRHAMTYGVEGIRIIKEITRICQSHLEFIIKMTKKQMKKPPIMTKSGVYSVACDIETLSSVVCLACGEPPSEEKKLLKCSKCLLARYCDATCQKKHWKEHKPNCCK